MNHTVIKLLFLLSQSIHLHIFKVLSSNYKMFFNKHVNIEIMVMMTTKYMSAPLFPLENGKMHSCVSWNYFLHWTGVGRGKIMCQIMTMVVDKHRANVATTCIINITLLLTFTISYIIHPRRWISPSFYMAWLSAHMHMCSSHCLLLNICLQPLTGHSTAFSWHWLICRETWHLKEHNIEKTKLKRLIVRLVPVEDPGGLYDQSEAWYYFFTSEKNRIRFSRH